MSVYHFIVGVRFLPTILNQPIEKVCLAGRLLKYLLCLMNRITKCIASSGLISVTSVHQHTTNGNADNTNQLGSVFISMQRIIICQSAALANL